MRRLKLKLNKLSYPIFISDKLKGLSSKLKELNFPGRVVVVTMKSIAVLYKEDLITELKLKGFDAFFEIIPDGEKSKSFSQLKDSINNISRQVSSNPFFLIAFGGGVVGDLSGTIASIYKRGINYIQLPTTLLSQVDSSIGGKVAIDLETGKNLVGAFYHPKMVYSNIGFLESLPDREFQNGMAEVIKYGIIKDKKIFILMEDLCSSFPEAVNIYNMLKDNIEELIYRCSKIKSDIVSVDEKDTKKIRAKLNFGHTIGHAIEAASEYDRAYSHGQAISIGMLCAVDISLELNMLRDNTILNRLENILNFFKLPTCVDSNIDVDKIMKFFWYDKKFVEGTPRMVLPIMLGKVDVVDNVPVGVVKRVLDKRIK